ncbi:MAG TPA: VOC family protein [Myxococcales bacterium]|nr:VOC family protein [Myxococcales bacterium]
MNERTFEILNLDHLVLRTRDLPRLRDFYLELGCSIERDRRADLGMIQLRIGASMLDIVDVHGPIGQSESKGGATDDNLDHGNLDHRNLDHYAVRIEPYDEVAILAFCEARAIPAEAPSFPLLGADGYGPAVYITDPDGNRLELKGPPNPEHGPG